MELHKIFLHSQHWSKAHLLQTYNKNKNMKGLKPLKCVGEGFDVVDMMLNSTSNYYPTFPIVFALATCSFLNMVEEFTYM